jgi:hypothetical protein
MATEEHRLPAEHETALIPIVVGVTGHRDLRPEDIPGLEKKVRRIFQFLRDKYPQTPLLVLSPLAEGADRLVARVALAHFGTRLIAPLPVSQGEYEKDFTQPGSLEEFRTLLGKGSCLSLPLVKGNTEKGISQYGPERDRQYAQAGAYIVRNSQVLIALWDGRQTGMEGGTAQIVTFAMNGIPEPYAPPSGPLDTSEGPLLFHIVTPRKSQDSVPPDEAFRTMILGQEEEKRTGEVTSPRFGFTEKPLDYRKIPKPFDRVNDCVNGFNRDSLRYFSKLRDQIKKSKNDVIPDSDVPKLPSTAASILSLYGVADTLAMYYQKWSTRAMKFLFILFAAAVLVFDLYAHLIKEPWMLALFPATLFLAILVYFLAKEKLDIQNKYQDYRALAEGLRVQLFWRLAGLSHDVADHYLRKQRSELDWIRNAIRAWNVPSVRHCGPGYLEDAASLNESNIRLVLKLWVDKQMDFFKTRTERNVRNLHRYKLWTIAFFLIGVLLAIEVVFADWLFHQKSTIGNLHSWFMVIVGFLPALAAVFEGYAEKMAFLAQARRYAWMRNLFTKAANRMVGLKNCRNWADLNRAIFELGKEALEENGDWVLLHRERPLTWIRG